MNLEDHELVPLKTKARCRDGKIAIFLGKTDSGNYYRFAKTKESGAAYAFRIYPNGTTHGDTEVSESTDDDDIMAVSKPWMPAEGDRVSICGIVETVDSQNCMRFNMGHERTDFATVVRAGNAGHPDFFIVLYQSREYQVHRDNLRRYTR